jgi:hypothetical protein
MTRKLKPGDLDYLTDPCDDLACATAMIGLDMFTGDKMQAQALMDRFDFNCPDLRQRFGGPHWEGPGEGFRDLIGNPPVLEPQADSLLGRRHVRYVP